MPEPASVNARGWKVERCLTSLEREDSVLPSTGRRLDKITWDVSVVCPGASPRGTGLPRAIGFQWTSSAAENNHLEHWFERGGWSHIAFSLCGIGSEGMV